MATQGSQANAKDDTVYLAVRGGGAFSVLATDLGQRGDNQTNGGTWTYEASPAANYNFASTSSWTIEIHCSTDNNDTGYLYAYDTGADLLALSLDGSGRVQARLGASVIATLALPGIGAGAEEFVIAWATEPNALTTGAGDAQRSELRAFNITDGSYDQTVFTHAARSAHSGDAVVWASSTGGANNFNGTARGVRISNGRFRTATETHEDYVATTSAPTITGQTRCEFPMVHRSCALLDPGNIAGPVLAMGAASVRDNGLRLLSPIVNEDFQELTTYSGSGLTGAPTQWSRTAPDSLYTMLGAYVYYREIPAFVDRLKVRVNLQQWRTSGATNDRVHLRMYSLNRPPQPVDGVVDDDGALQIRQASASIATSHGSGAAAGGWLDLGLMQIARNSDGATWLALAVRIEDLSGTPANNRLRINAITIEPVLT